MPRGEKTKELWQSAAYRNNVLAGLKVWGQGHHIIKQCLTCGNDFEVTYARRYRGYCAKECGYLAISRQKRVHNPGALKPGNQVNLGRRWTNEQKRRRGVGWVGQRNPKWRGGICKEHILIRGSSEYKAWRSEVFRRDNWTCQMCGKRGGTIHADHIQQFALYPELRFVLANGRTLCVSCHKTTDSYGKAIRSV